MTIYKLKRHLPKYISINKVGNTLHLDDDNSTWYIDVDLSMTGRFESVGVVPYKIMDLVLKFVNTPINKRKNNTILNELHKILNKYRTFQGFYCPLCKDNITVSYPNSPCFFCLDNKYGLLNTAYSNFKDISYGEVKELQDFINKNEHSVLTKLNFSCTANNKLKSNSNPNDNTEIIVYKYISYKSNIDVYVSSKQVSSAHINKVVDFECNSDMGFNWRTTIPLLKDVSLSKSYLHNLLAYR